MFDFLVFPNESCFCASTWSVLVHQLGESPSEVNGCRSSVRDEWTESRVASFLYKLNFFYYPGSERANKQGSWALIKSLRICWQDFDKKTDLQIDKFNYRIMICFCGHGRNILLD